MGGSDFTERAMGYVHAQIVKVLDGRDGLVKAELLHRHDGRYDTASFNGLMPTRGATTRHIGPRSMNPDCMTMPNKRSETPPPQYRRLN